MHTKFWRKTIKYEEIGAVSKVGNDRAQRGRNLETKVKDSEIGCHGYLVSYLGFKELTVNKV